MGLTERGRGVPVRLQASDPYHHVSMGHLCESQPLPVRKDLHPEDVAVSMPGRRLQVDLGGHPPLGPFPDRDAGQGRIDPLATMLGILDRCEPSLSVDATAEMAGVFLPERVSIPRRQRPFSRF